MTIYLQTRYTRPIEREYEAWIVAGIERYLERAGIGYQLWAVSPDDEKSWPADEALSFNSKLIGLQFKRASLAAGPIGPSRLHWPLHSPPGQFALVQMHAEIHYCLPTFINREYRKEALHHCLFWRPDAGATDKNPWYDNPASKSPFSRLSGCPRWGRFLETIQNCEAGKKINGPGDLADSYRALIHSLRHPGAGVKSIELTDSLSFRGEAPLDCRGLYMLQISLNGA